MTTRRTAEEIRYDRDQIVQYVRGADTEWTRLAEWARSQDVAALVKAGELEKQVRREFDKARGRYVENMFGRAAVVQRLRAYYKIGGVKA